MIIPAQTGNTQRSLQMRRVGVVSDAGEALCLHKEDLSEQHRRSLQHLPCPVLRTPARGRPDPPAASPAEAWAAERSRSRGLNRQGSQAVQTLTHSCLEQRRGLPPPFLLRGGRVANGLRGRLAGCQASREYRPAPRSSAGLRGPGRRRGRAARSRPVPSRSFGGAGGGRGGPAAFPRASYLRRLG